MRCEYVLPQQLYFDEVLVLIQMWMFQVRPIPGASGGNNRDNSIGTTYSLPQP